jgi:aspartyl-tRNA(Asn)/glutamyl-tRNA(Gln) amidotransferase subunit A
MTRSDPDLVDLTLSEAGRRLRALDLSPLDLTRACLERIERLDPRLNAFITVTAEEALAQARAAGAELAHGRDRGPLHGIPVALKDLVDVAGVRTTGASAAFAERVAARDADVTARLRAGGAVLLGKLNLHELAYGASSIVGHFGPVANPWLVGRTAGGSSAGSAVAVATGMCYGAVGTDTGGSIRQPASFCGVVGLKPTWARVSVRGVVPLAASLDHVGPMTRSVADAALMFAVMAGTAPPPLERLARRWRVGVARAHFFEGLDPEVAAALDGALAVLRHLGCELRDVTIPADTDTTVFRGEAWEEHGARATATPELFQPETLRRIRDGAGVGAELLARSRRALAETRSRAAALFEHLDLLVTPTTVAPAFEVGDPPEVTPDLRDRELVSLRNTRPFNALGLPSVSVPCGVTTEGLPIGMQITGAPQDEVAVLGLAHAYERAAGARRTLPLG